MAGKGRTLPLPPVPNNGPQSGLKQTAFSQSKVITPELSMREGHRQRTKAVEPMPLGSDHHHVGMVAPAPENRRAAETNRGDRGLGAVSICSGA
jgi:hypothetical protein